MSGLFGGDVKTPDPTPPAPMPDPEDVLAKRKSRKTATGPVTSSAATDKLAPVPGTIGREYSRSTLGAN